MIFGFLLKLAAAVVLTAVAQALAPKPPQRVPTQRQRTPTSPIREFNAPTADANRPIPIVFGTVVVKSPNVLHTAHKNSLAIQDMSRAEYRLSVHYGICAGKIDAIRRVRIAEKTCVANPSGSTILDLPNFNGGREKDGGILGKLIWTDGSSDQILPAEITELYGETPMSMPGYRGIATVCFRKGPDLSTVSPVDSAGGSADAGATTALDNSNRAGRDGMLWGQSPFIPPVDLMVTRITEILPAWFDATRAIPFPNTVTTTFRDEITDIEYDIGDNINPVHALRECLLNDEWGGEIAAIFLDDGSFRMAAQTMFNEGLGVSFLFDQETDVNEIVQILLNHMGTIIYISPLTGLVTLESLRGNYNVEDLTTYDVTNSRVVSVIRQASGEIVNEVMLSWTNPINEQTEPATVQDLAGISRAGATISSRINFTGIRDVETAFLLAERELASSAEQMLATELDLDRSARGIRPGSVIIANHPEHFIDNVVLRVLRVDYGRPGEDRIRVNCVEDVFGRNIPNFNRPGQGGVASSPIHFGLTRGDGEIVLAWQPPASDGGSPVLGYEFSKNGGPWQPAGDASARSHTDIVVNGVANSYQVRAYTKIGPGAPSVTRSNMSSTSAPTGPSVPRDYRAIAVGNELQLRWQPPVDDGGATIIRYEYQLDGGDWIAIPVGDDLIHSILNMPPDRQFPVAMRAVNSVSPGAETAVIHVTIRDLLAIGYARPPMARGGYGRGGVGLAFLWWDNPYAYYQNHSRAIIYRATTNDFGVATQVGVSAGISFEDANSEAGTYYYWIVWQSKAMINGPQSDAIEIVIEEPVGNIITRLSNQIANDPLTSELLSPIEDLGSKTDLNRLALPQQAVARTFVEGYFRLMAGLVGNVESVVTQVKSNVDGLVDIVAGLELGATPNTFSGATRAEAEMARDLFAGTNSSWVAGYRGGMRHILLSWAIGNGQIRQQYQNYGTADPYDPADWSDVGDEFLTNSIGAAALMELSAKVRLIENVDGSTRLAQLARWLVKTQVGDLVGGVGLLNDGTTTKFYVAADKFAIIPPGLEVEPDNDNTVLPFIVQDGTVYIDIAKISEGNIFDLAIGNKIQSSNFLAATPTTPRAASIEIAGVTFTHDTPGEAANGYVVSLEYELSTQPSTVAVTDGSTIVTMRITEGAIDRADIVALVNASSAPVTASGTGTFNLDIFTDFSTNRDPTKDFNTLSAAGNNHCTGLWSDKITMWVGDDSDNKIYAYNTVSYTHLTLPTTPHV